MKSGGQDCHAKESGAHTGDISAEMLKDAGASHVIVGHSERRTDHGEDDATVRAKAEAAWRAGLVAIICIGETRAERESGATFDVLSRQIDGSVATMATARNTVIAYEPVWAIGTGLTPTADDVAEAHAHIRARLREKLEPRRVRMRILYGGSVKPSNARELLVHRQCRRCAGRRRQPEGVGFPRHRRILSRDRLRCIEVQVMPARKWRLARALNISALHSGLTHPYSATGLEMPRKPCI